MNSQDDDQFSAEAEIDTAIVLFGLDEIQQCLRNGSESEKQAALTIALTRGKAAIKLVIDALKDPNPNIQQTALDLLRDRSEPEVQEAIWNYLNLPQPSQERDYKALQQLLAASQWQTADEITCSIILAMAERQGAWLRKEDIQKLVVTDLIILDRLWRFYSGDRFGFTVQAQIWETCKQEECSPRSYNSFGVCYSFSKRVGWNMKSYNTRYLPNYDFKRNTKIPYDLSAPVGNLPSTFALGGGENNQEYEPADTESTMGFYAPARYYYTWSKDSFFGEHLLIHFFQIIEMLLHR